MEDLIIDLEQWIEEVRVEGYSTHIIKNALYEVANSILVEDEEEEEEDDF